MPLIKEINDQNAHIFIWKIEESEEFFLSQIKESVATEIHHPKRKIEFLAGRFLLKKLMPEISISSIITSENGKPYADDFDFNFSISHSYPYVAVGMIFLKQIGIDIQIFSEKIVRIQHKFLNEEEIQLCNQNATLLNICWNAKESIYKWLGTGGQTFKNDFIIKRIQKNNESFMIEALVNINENRLKPVQLTGLVFEEFSMTYIIENEIVAE